MKNKMIYLFALTFLLQSCYTYHNVNLDTHKLRMGSVYKINLNGKRTKIRIISCSDTLVKVKIGKKESQIKISEIGKIKEREFSVGKTAVLATPSLRGGRVGLKRSGI